MEKLKKAVENTVMDELLRANEKFPLFCSKHEGYAVIKEELEKTSEALNDLEQYMSIFWGDIRGKGISGFNTEPDLMKQMYDQAVEVAAEAIQTAAMILKHDMSFIGQEERTE